MPSAATAAAVEAAGLRRGRSGAITNRKRREEHGERSLLGVQQQLTRSLCEIEA